tara:strand:+ start:540 stop:782 length:243 start_codon:yes stop_codon:yes gene_type:complete
MSKVEEFANNFEYNNGLWVTKTTTNLIQIASNIVNNDNILCNDITYMPLLKIHQKYTTPENNRLHSLTPHEFSICKQCFL